MPPSLNELIKLKSLLATQSLEKRLALSIQESVRAVKQLESEKALLFIDSASALIAKTFEAGGKILLAGNGGSLCDAMHFAEELTGFFRVKRKALPAIALGDPSHLTCVGNDLGFEEVFSRAVEAYGKKEDLFIGLTTSGNSPNLIKAFQTAAKMGLSTVAFLGKGGGKLKGVADLELSIDGFSTSDRIQEVHMAAAHVIIELVEYRLFPQLLSSDLT